MTTDAHKTTATGSIDYAHYIRASHQLRSESAHAGLRRLADLVRGIFSRPEPAQVVPFAPDGADAARGFAQDPSTISVSKAA